MLLSDNVYYVFPAMFNMRQQDSYGSGSTVWFTENKSFAYIYLIFYVGEIFVEYNIGYSKATLSNH